MKTKYALPDWAKSQITRWDRNNMVEDICKEHSCGHPNREWMESKENKNADGSYKDSGIHGCCLCCRRGKNEQ